MDKLPKDILDKIDTDFIKIEAMEIKKLLTKLYADNLVIGTIIQAIRGILFLSNGDINQIRNAIFFSLGEDPRDIIMEAEEKAGNHGHWFSIPFDELDNFSGDLPRNTTIQEEEGDLPF